MHLDLRRRTSTRGQGHAKWRSLREGERRCRADRPCRTVDLDVCRGVAEAHDGRGEPGRRWAEEGAQVARDVGGAGPDDRQEGGDGVVDDPVDGVRVEPVGPQDAEGGEEGRELR